MGNVATRLLSLLLMMQSRPSWKASELAATLEVSERTIHRYMGMLDEIGVPIYSERGPYGGFSLLRGQRLPPLLFTAEEATVLTMGASLVREVWGQTYGDAVTSSIAKLDNVLPDDLREEVAEARRSLVVGGLARREPGLWEESLDVLRRCVRDRRCAHIAYRAQGREEETERVVEPYALTFQSGLWYLIAFCRLRGEMRTFRVDRVARAAVLTEPYVLPRTFSVTEYIHSTLWPPPDHSVMVWLDADVAAEVRERDGNWMRLSDNPDGSVVARFGVNGLEWPTTWVLGWGGKARALEPPELVERVRRAVLEMVETYDLLPVEA
jgi:predicted DNA-binding transcriptional regulator YafY